MLEKIKLMLGFTEEDTDQDEKLSLIINQTRQRLKVKLRGNEPPSDLDYIIIEVAIIRFNRIGSEGLSGHTVEGEAQTFLDSDFDGFTADIQEWLNTQKENTQGKVRFL